MNKVDYKKLNSYLNDIFVVLEENDQFLLRNIDEIITYNNSFISLMRKQTLKQKVKRNHLTFQDVVNLASEILGSINPKYEEMSKDLIERGILDFAYNKEYRDSHFFHYNDIDEINISREYNYNDVVTLIHEFFHYTNACDKISSIKHLLDEFISIYFELYATNYLLDKGINENEIGKFDRLNSAYRSACNFFNYEFIFWAYEKIGNIDETTPELISNHLFRLPENYFERDCNDFLEKIDDLVDKMNSSELPYVKKSKDLYQFQYGSAYRYVLGSMLAFYALKNCRMEDMIKLNENINNENDILIVLKNIGIDVEDPNTLNEILDSIEDYIVEKEKIR